jgi:hypothetical protein
MIKKFWYNITCIPYRIKWNTLDIYRAIKFGFQRMFRGYDNSDVWEFFYNFTDRNYKILNKFICKNKCHPVNLTEEEWDDILQEMCKHLYMMDEHNVIDYLKTGMPKGWRPASNSVYEIMERHKNEFFDLMKEHFYDLWY